MLILLYAHINDTYAHVVQVDTVLTTQGSNSRQCNSMLRSLILMS